MTGAEKIYYKGTYVLLWNLAHVRTQLCGRNSAQPPGWGQPCPAPQQSLCFSPREAGCPLLPQHPHPGLGCPDSALKGKACSSLSVFPGQFSPPSVLCGPGAPRRRPGADGGLSAPGQGQEGQWVSYAARQPGHTSPALAAFATKNSPSHRALLLSLQPGCCFSGWGLLATVLCVQSTVTLAATGPYLTQAGVHGVSCSVAVTVWTHGGFLESPHLL